MQDLDDFPPTPSIRVILTASAISCLCVGILSLHQEYGRYNEIKHMLINQTNHITLDPTIDNVYDTEYMRYFCKGLNPYNITICETALERLKLSGGDLDSETIITYYIPNLYYYFILICKILSALFVGSLFIVSCSFISFCMKRWYKH